MSKLLVIVIICSLSVVDAQACSVCFGDPNSLMTKGLNAGIFVLFAVLLAVLGSFAVFFLRYRARLKALDNQS